MLSQLPKITYMYIIMMWADVRLRDVSQNQTAKIVLIAL